MADELKNMAGLFKSTRTRTIVLLTVFVLAVALIVAYFVFRTRVAPNSGNVNLVNVPGAIQSIPGSLSPTTQYARLQNTQNIQNAEQALKTGQSAIPTIIRAEKVTGEGKTTAGGGPGFSALVAQQEGGGAAKNLAIDEVRNSHCSVTSVQKAKNLGVDVAALKQAGCDATQLKNAGYDLPTLQEAGFNICDLKNAGYTPAQLLSAGYSPNELRAAGFSPAEVQSLPTNVPGLPASISAASLIAANCDPAALKKAHDAGVSATTLRKITGCGAAALKAAGYSAADLKAAGYSPAELRNAGFTAKDLKEAGFSPRELLAGGFTPDELKAAGFPPTAVEAAEKSLMKLPGGYTPESLKKAGCGREALAAERRAGISAETIRQLVGCSAAELAAAGYTPAELKKAGFSAGELRHAGFTAQQLKDAGFSAKDLKDAGFTPAELKAAGFTPQQLKDAGFSAADLKKAGFNAQQLKDAGFSAADLKAAGFTPKELQNAGFTPEQLKNAGFTADQLKAAGYTPSQLAMAGFTPQETGLATQQAPLGPSLAAAGGDPNLQRVLARQAQQMTDQQIQQKVNEYKTAMQTQASQLFNTWREVSPQSAERANKSDENGAAGEGGTTKGAVGTTQGGGSSTKKPLVKAGDIMFAVLNTAINSDEPGPVMATVVGGPLKGAKLLGTLSTGTRFSQKVILSFNTMSIPNRDKTVTVNAFAIDPNTARTALSSNTDNHYLQRFGAVFATAFMQGFGQAVIQSGSTITRDGQGGTTATTAVLSTGDKALVGLGQVGQQMGALASRNANRPPTVYVYSGIGMGILFMADVTPDDNS